jgi:Cu2+-exporting ATPase
LLADKAALWLTIIALVSGVATFLYWYFQNMELSFAIERMVTVIVICCPHALGLAVPLVVAKSTALSAQKGLLIKNRTSFENSRKVTTIVFDKTGTLTFGNFEVSKIGVFDNALSEKEIIKTCISIRTKFRTSYCNGYFTKSKRPFYYNFQY